MPPRPSFPAALASRVSALRTLQTTPPLPPPTHPLPPSDPSSSSSSSSSSSRLAAIPPHLPSLLPSTSPTSFPTNVPSALSLLRDQSTPCTGIYLLARLHSRTYLLHPRDILTLPTLKPLQPPGTTLSLTRILEVGSRDWAIRSPAADGKELRKQMDWDARGLETIPSSVTTCQLTVLEHTRSPMEERLKKKRRKGYQKTIKAKHGWTRLRVGDIILGDGSSQATPSNITLGTPTPVE